MSEQQENISDDLGDYSLDDEDQLQPIDTLMDEQGDDVLDAGYSPPDTDRGSRMHGVTLEEQHRDETIDQRIEQELPDPNTAYGAPEAVTGSREWERVGITPDVPVPADSALPVAHVLALAAIGERTSDAARKRELALLAEAVRAAARPMPRSVESLRRLVGTYEGGQFVTVEGGRLLYQPRHAQPRVVLVPLGQDTFAGGSTRYEFAERAGRVDLRVVASDGSAITYPRTSDTAPVRPSSGTRSSAPAP